MEPLKNYVDDRYYHGIIDYAERDDMLMDSSIYNAAYNSIKRFMSSRIPLGCRISYINSARLRGTKQTKSLKYYTNNYDDRFVVIDSEDHTDQNSNYVSKRRLKMNNNNELMNYIKEKVKTNVLKMVKEHFGVSVDLIYNDPQYIKFLSWLRKYDKDFKLHVEKQKTLSGKPVYWLGDVDFIVKVADKTYARIYTRSAIRSTYDDIDKMQKRVPENLIRIYIFGKECFKIAKLLKKIENESYSIGSYKITSAMNEESRPTVYYNLLNGRKKDSVFLNDNIREEITYFIDKFFSNKAIYDKRNLNYKIGILLYGEPGTGKTTIANMIPTEYKCDMVTINMSEFSTLNIDFITSALNADDHTYVVVLEDIDCVIGDRESAIEDLENKKNVNKLLQFLDSASSPSNVIFVATTNHIEKLDSAIIRAGRFDLVVNVSNINKNAAVRMCKSFGLHDMEIINEMIDNNIEDSKINPAKLQNLILQKIEPSNN